MKYFLFFAVLFSGCVFSKSHSSEFYEIKTYEKKIVLSIHLYNKEKIPLTKEFVEPNASILWHNYSIPRGSLSIHKTTTIRIPPRSGFEVEFDITDRFDFREGLHSYIFYIYNDMIHKKGFTTIKFKFNNSFRRPYFTDNQVLSPPKL